MSSYIPITGFKATVCASTGDNRHNCAPTRWGRKERLSHENLAYKIAALICTVSNEK